MHLKSLTLKGFKSFASATTLAFEPGVTCVVGPNGSGKSNIVDAIAWVMGEQGAKSLRGGAMSDVIFAGTSGRAPLGRAEVALTIYHRCQNVKKTQSFTIYEWDGMNLLHVLGLSQLFVHLLSSICALNLSGKY